MNRGRRNLIIALSVLAGVLVCGIVVATASAARSRYDAKMAEYQGQVDKFSADQKALEDENADLKRQLRNVSAEGQRQADRLAAANEKLAGLRNELAAALKEVADLEKKYAEIATTEDVATEVAADGRHDGNHGDRGTGRSAGCRGRRRQCGRRPGRP